MHGYSESWILVRVEIIVSIDFSRVHAAMVPAVRIVYYIILRVHRYGYFSNESFHLTAHAARPARLTWLPQAVTVASGGVPPTFSYKAPTLITQWLELCAGQPIGMA